MTVWGGNDGTSSFNTGGRYDPGTNSWTATSAINAPLARYGHTAVRAGNEMIIWGGTNNSTYFNTGGRYNLGADSWIATSTTNSPSARGFHTAVWTGSEMIVWGGYNGSYSEHRREILRAIWFADAYSNTNCNSDTESHTDFASSSDSGTASVKTLISDLVTNVGVSREGSRGLQPFLYARPKFSNADFQIATEKNMHSPLEGHRPRAAHHLAEIFDRGK